jgi:hypothetical protein
VYELQLFALPGGDPLPAPAALGAVGTAVALSADGRVLAVQREGGVAVVDRASSRVRATIPSLGSRIRLSRDGGLLAQVSFGDRDAIAM